MADFVAEEVADSSGEEGSGSECEPEPMPLPGASALTRSTVADYEVHESYTADTRDHEDHTFCGVMFDLIAKDALPLDGLIVRSLWIRGQLGPIRVYSTPNSFEHKRESPREWQTNYEGTHAPSQDDLVELPLTLPIELSPGGSCGIYVHSTRPDDLSIVYDNQREEITHEDLYFRIMPGVAHLSPRPFAGHGGAWWASWRSHREFVGRVSVGLRFKLWNPCAAVHSKFPEDFQKVVLTLLMGARRNDCALSMLQDDILYFILNMCRWDWTPDALDKAKAADPGLRNQAANHRSAYRRRHHGNYDRYDAQEFEHDDDDDEDDDEDFDGESYDEFEDGEEDEDDNEEQQEDEEADNLGTQGSPGDANGDDA